MKKRIIPIRIRRPDDMHFHPRSGRMLQIVLPYTSKVFSRAVAMGNLLRPVVTADDAAVYQREILLNVDDYFTPIMTIMLTKQTTPEIISEAFRGGIRVLKYIPNNVSTNSENGVVLTELQNYYPVLKKVEELGMVFSGHWESPFDKKGIAVPEMAREVEAIRFLDWVVESFPRLKVVVEHASTERMIEYVKEAPGNVGATLTVHHAILVYSDVCDDTDKIYNPHHYCKPIAKSPSDRDAVIKAMISGNPKFFFGSDSAPHPLSAKEKIFPSAGIFTAPVALPLLCGLFEENKALSQLEDFVARFGAEFYGLPLNDDKVVLSKKIWTVPECIEDIHIFKGGERLNWYVENR